MLEECETYKCSGCSDISKGENRSYTPKVSVMGTELKISHENLSEDRRWGAFWKARPLQHHFRRVCLMLLNSLALREVLQAVLCSWI